ncbi:MAG: glycosyltransferase family 2 protein [Burkholderiales bacterium]
MSAARITPVLVTYNSARILPWSLPPLQGCAEIIVVDNHSSDDTLTQVRALLPQARVIEAGRNLGFGRANNLGIAAVTTDYALLLNPDARLEPDALQRLAEAAERYPEAAILAPMLFDAPGQIGDFFRGPFFARASKPAPEPAGDLCADFVTGAAMLLNLRLMREVGFFDPWFFLYFEDDDLCLRVRRAGHPIMVVHAAQAEHHTRQSSTPSARNTFRRMYCMTLSKLYITGKYFGTARCVAMALRIGVGSALALLPALLTPRRDRALRQAGRCAAVLAAPLQLRRRHCFDPNR